MSNNATEAMLRLARGADELSSLAGSLSTEAMLRASRLSTEPDEQQGAPNAAAPNAAAAALASLTKAIAKLQTATDLILQEGRLRRRGPLLLSRDPLAPRAEGLRRMAKGLPLPPVTSVPPSAIRAPLAAGLMQMAKSGSGSRSLLLMQKAMDLPLPPSRPSSPSPPSDPEDDATQTAPDSGEPAKDFQSHESQEEQ